MCVIAMSLRAATKAARDCGPGHRVWVYVCRVVLMDRIRQVIRPTHRFDPFVAPSLSRDFDQLNLLYLPAK